MRHEVFIEEVVCDLGERLLTPRNSLIVSRAAIQLQQTHQITEVTMAKAVAGPKSVVPEIVLALTDIVVDDRPPAPH